ncbi:MAG: cysteine desulfurase [Alkalinema sp. RU_4_3]|nr:cysteine desulfurase [Alkalinema sp. RU_4_3]
MQIYLDHSATTPPHPEVIRLMQQVMVEQWGNPSSLHHWGNRSALTLERSRIQVSRLINALPDSIHFTSGGTEANNLAMFGITQKYQMPQHIIISAIEHSAISQPAARLEAEGWVVTRLAVDRTGRIDPKDLQTALRPNTVLVSIIWGQSEIGTLQPIDELAAIAHHHGAIFHTDAVQAAGRLAIDVQHTPIDLLSLSSHKLYGPQGSGALYVRPDLELVPLIGGGGQESGVRSGTQAVANIAGFGLAAEMTVDRMVEENSRLMALRDRLFDLLADTPLMPTGHRLYRLPHHVSFCLPETPDVSGKELVRQMNLAGIGISAGAACSSGKITPSPILVAIGWDEAAAKTGIRFTLGMGTTEADVDWTAMVLGQVLERAIVPGRVMRR